MPCLQAGRETPSRPIHFNQLPPATTLYLIWPLLGDPYVLELLFTNLDISSVTAMLTKFSTGISFIKPNPKDMPILLAVAVISKSEDTVRYLMDKGHTIRARKRGVS